MIKPRLRLKIKIRHVKAKVEENLEFFGLFAFIEFMEFIAFIAFVESKCRRLHSQLFIRQQQREYFLGVVNSQNKIAKETVYPK